MRVFISWSGDLSRELAQALRKWLPQVIQAVKPYFSPSDIEKGVKWDAEISKELTQSDFCVIALTRESLSSVWIMFEAGAIYHSHNKARVCTVLFDLEPTDIQGPLERFQATRFSKPEMLQLLKTINANLGDNRLEDDVLDGVFEKFWPDLESEVKRILTARTLSKAPTRDERSLLEETVGLARTISKEQNDLRLTLSTILNFLTTLRGVPNYGNEMVRALLGNSSQGVAPPNPTILAAAVDAASRAWSIPGPPGPPGPGSSPIPSATSPSE